MVVSEAIAREWHAALADAEIDPSAACLIQVPGPESADACGAKYWRPGDPPDPEVLAVLAGSVRDDAHHVALWGDHTIEASSGLLRHELEHARQLAAHGGQLLHLFQAAEDGLIERIGGVPGSARLYQEIPMERDANATAARFVRDRFGATRVDALVTAGDPDAAALRDLGEPGPMATLTRRMELFLLDLDERCRAFRDGMSSRWRR